MTTSISQTFAGNNSNNPATFMSQSETVLQQLVKANERLEALRGEMAQAKFSYMDGYEGGKQEARDASHEEIKGLTAERDAALARLAAIEAQEPACWGMPHADGRIYDVICSEEHAEIEGRYTVPLFAAAGASPQPVQPSPAREWTTMQMRCIEEGYGVCNEDSYFDARKGRDSTEARNIFTAAHRMGWSAAINAKETK